MYYKTVPVQQKFKQLDMQLEMFNQFYGLETPIVKKLSTTYPQTKTFQMDTMIHKTPNFKAPLSELSKKYNLVPQAMEKRITQGTYAYQQFKIPKSSGGYRTILAPTDALKELQRDICDMISYGYHLWSHNNAFAYIPKRSTRDCMQVHLDNKSRWYLKLDIKDFFPSSNKKFVMNRLFNLHPLYHMKTSAVFARVMEACFYNEALPQGACTSPLLSNLIMVPNDYQINKHCWNKFGIPTKGRFKYTRYADDIIISCTESFNHMLVASYVALALSDTPYKINEKKTRYGSVAGRNWNLGLMLNKDMKITLGHKRKERLKAGINNIFRDTVLFNLWDLADVQHLLGELSYFAHIEPEYSTYLTNKYAKKYDITYTKVRKYQLRV